MSSKGATFRYEYPRPAVAADVVGFCYREEQLRVLQILRRDEPHAGRWAFPGGFMDHADDRARGETLQMAAARELQEEAGLTGLELLPGGWFDTAGRDPRSRIITAMFVGIATPEDFEKARPGDDAAQLRWVELAAASPDELAFDHAQMFKLACRQLRRYLGEKPPLARRWLPKIFAVRELRSIFEQLDAVLDTPEDQAQGLNFSRRWQRMIEDQHVHPLQDGRARFPPRKPA